MATTDQHIARADAAETASTTSRAAEIRAEHLGREASIHALGILFSLLGVIVLFATIFALSTGSDAGLEVRPGSLGIVDVVAYVVGIAATLTVGYGLRRLRRWARIGGIVLCGIFVLRIPDGTLISSYFLYLLLSAKGKRVFAPDYRAILAATPQVKHPRSTVVWTVLGAVLTEVALQALRIVIRGGSQ